MFLSKKQYMLMNADGGDGGSGGAGGAPGEGSKTTEGAEQFAKLKTEKENWKKAADDAKAEAEALKAQLKAKDIAEATVKEDYKKLAELKDAQAKEWETKFNEQNTKLTEKEKAIQLSQKRGAIKKELVANGVDEKATDAALRLVDLDSVKFDEEANAFYGVDGAVKSLREQLPQLFGTKVNVPGGGAPNVDTKTLSKETFGQLSLKEMKEKQHELMKANGVQMRK